MSLETLHRHHYSESDVLPDEQQPVKPDGAWMQDPGNGATISEFHGKWLVQWRGTNNSLQAQYHSTLDGAHRNASRVTRGRMGRHAALAITDERLTAPRSSTGRRAA